LKVLQHVSDHKMIHHQGALYSTWLKLQEWFYHVRWHGRGRPRPCQDSMMMDPLWSETCWSTFKYFIILIVSTNYIIVYKLDNNVFICWWCTVQTWRAFFSFKRPAPTAFHISKERNVSICVKLKYVDRFAYCLWRSHFLTL